MFISWQVEVIDIITLFLYTTRRPKTISFKKQRNINYQHKLRNEAVTEHIRKQMVHGTENAETP